MSCRYVFIVGERQAGKTALFARLAHLPANYSIPKDKVPAEIRMVHGSERGAYAVTLPGLLSADPAVRRKAGHLADISHGVLTCMVYITTVEDNPAEVSRTEPSM